jgi:cytochrome c-type biogenesis protein CcmH/NrfG
MQQAVAFAASNEEAWSGLGRCYYSQSEFAEAKQAFARAGDGAQRFEGRGEFEARL